MTDNNDWRVTIALRQPADVQRVRQHLSAHEVAEDVHNRLGRSVAVSAGDAQVFLYAGSELAAAQARQVASEVLDQLGIQAEFTVDRWHPAEERWESAEVAMPRTDTEREAEHQKLLADETAESLTAGYAQWQARAELPSHHEAAELADKLRAQGRTVIQRSNFLVVGANNEDEARELAELIRREAPSDATVRAEPAGVLLPFIPF